MVAYDNRDVFATGNTPESARRAFLNKLLSNANGRDLVQAGSAQLSLDAVISRIAVMSDSILFLVEGEQEKTIFSVPRETNFEAPLSEVGDNIRIKYSPVDTSPQPVSCFDNLEIGGESCI